LAAAYTLLPHVKGKPVTRRTALSRRDDLSIDERARASARICERALAELTSGSTRELVIAVYSPKASEVDTGSLDRALRAAGHRVVYPRVVEGQRELVFREVAPGELVASRFGLREPLHGAREVELAAIDAFCIPGIAFDRDGWRIGWGHGHYDATLAHAPGARRLGLAFECQLIDAVEHDPHDARMHAVITEANLYKAHD
jgi:5-formyltetrahydrofolate cyclo-ligase